MRWPHPTPYPYSAAWSRSSVKLTCRAAQRKTRQKKKRKRRRRRAVAKKKNNNHQRFNIKHSYMNVHWP